MNKISDTVSLCEHCFRHIPAVKFERDGQMWLGKTCPKHSYVEHLIDPDAEFYLNYEYPKHPLTSYFIETTNRCNLTCPHCYQLPDNTSKDLPIDYIINQIKSWPDDGYSISLAGAEPTVRKDLDTLIKSIQQITGKPRKIIVLTNGVRLADIDYARQFVGIENLTWTIGLNHPDYQGHKVRAKQIQGIENCIALGLTIKNVSYTLESFDQLQYCLEEIQTFHPRICKQFRIRVGSDIGRNPDGEVLYLSQLVNSAKQIAELKDWSFVPDPQSGIRAHYPVYINGVYVKLIQWPDATTIDLNEMQTETWADLLPTKPISPLIHQVILRDASVNNGLMLYDLIPSEYQR
jgi:uncharacterized Fe-S cluster-containing radical SAM superfamily protein